MSNTKQKKWYLGINGEQKKLHISDVSQTIHSEEYIITECETQKQAFEIAFVLMKGWSPSDSTLIMQINSLQ